MRALLIIGVPALFLFGVWIGERLRSDGYAGHSFDYWRGWDEGRDHLRRLRDAVTDSQAEGGSDD